MTQFSLGPAILFVPADRPDRYAKAYERSDAIIIDLEDAVRPGDRPAARAALATHLTQLSALQQAVTVIRINPVASDDFLADVQLLTAHSVRYVMVPKVESATDIEKVAAALPNVLILALCETASGVISSVNVAQHSAVTALMWGSEDLMVSTRGTASRHRNGAYRDVPRYARAQVLLAAAAAGKGSIDTIHMDLSPTEHFIAESEDAAATGWTAKACVHPAQVEVVRQAYRPTTEDYEYARALLAGVSQQRGAFNFRDAMVDEPMIHQAKLVLQRGEELGCS